MDMERLVQARALLEDVTPLRSDCGRLCGGACCQGERGDAHGMLLFPGEAALYVSAAWAQVTPLPYALGGAPALLLTCDGACPRAQRPLACRLFPLFCRTEETGMDIVLDPRARGVCPLFRYGLQGLSQAFVQAARAAYSLLMQDDEGRAFLQDLSDACSLGVTRPARGAR